MARDLSPEQPPTGQPLPDAKITSLRSARDGSLWIGTPYGLFRLQDGELLSYSTAPIGISTIIEDHTGTIWVTRYRVTDGKGPLCRAVDRQLQCYGKSDGIPVSYGVGLTEDSLGNLWIGSYVLCRWRPGSSADFFRRGTEASEGESGRDRYRRRTVRVSLGSIGKGRAEAGRAPLRRRKVDQLCRSRVSMVPALTPRVYSLIVTTRYGWEQSPTGSIAFTMAKPITIGERTVYRATP